VSSLVVAPVVLPLLSAAVLLIVRNHRDLQRVIATTAAAAQLVVAGALLARVSGQGILVAQFGGWPAPFGIGFVADHLAAIMVLVTTVLALASAVYALRDIDAEREAGGYHPLAHVLVAGINGAFLTGDLFNLFVWFEVLLIASFVLLTLGGSRAQLEGGIKYVSVNLVASMLFLTAIGLLYGLTGTLNMAHLAALLPGEDGGLVTTIAMLFMIAFGIKAAVFPLFFWLPASYHTPPIAISAFFAGMLTKVGVYALIRSFTLLFVADVGYTHTILLWVGVVTMITGVLTAAAQSDVRKILSFHIISQIGYMIVGLALYTPLALAGAVFYLIHNIIAKANLFLIAGIARRLTGSFDLERSGGLYRAAPFLSVLFLISALGLAGIPPLSGFWAKLLIVLAALEQAQWWVAAAALGVGLLTLFSMTKIWQYAYWAPAPHGAPPQRRPSNFLYAPVVGLAALTLVLGLWSGPLIAVGDAAAAELFDRDRYVHAVLGSGAAGPEPALAGPAERQAATSAVGSGP
jgi:multicomponent Na+:H+ antiporter subunit D